MRGHAHGDMYRQATSLDRYVDRFTDTSTDMCACMHIYMRVNMCIHMYMEMLNAHVCREVASQHDTFEKFRDVEAIVKLRHI